MASRIEKMKWKMHLYKNRILLIWGLKNGLITPYDDDLIKKLKILNRISGQGWPQISVMVSDITDYDVGVMSGGKHLKLIADEGKLLYIKWNFSGDWDQFDGPVSAIGTLDSGFFGRNYYRQLIMNDFMVDNSEYL